MMDGEYAWDKIVRHFKKKESELQTSELQPGRSAVERTELQSELQSAW